MFSPAVRLPFRRRRARLSQGRSFRRQPKCANLPCVPTYIGNLTEDYLIYLNQSIYWCTLLNSSLVSVQSNAVITHTSWRFEVQCVYGSVGKWQTKIELTAVLRKDVGITRCWRHHKAIMQSYVRRLRMPLVAILRWISRRHRFIRLMLRCSVMHLHL